MAVLTAPTVVSSGGGSGQTRWALVSFPKVTAGDTFDVATLTAIAAFQTVYVAFFVALTNRTETFALATLAGTVVTIVGTGVAADSGLLLVVGE